MAKIVRHTMNLIYLNTQLSIMFALNAQAHYEEAVKKFRKGK